MCDNKILTTVTNTYKAIQDLVTLIFSQEEEEQQDNTQSHTQAYEEILSVELDLHCGG